jgi:hypothetical protein
MIDKEKILYNAPKSIVKSTGEEHVTTLKGSARRKERSKFLTSFIGDHNESIKDYLYEDVLKPFAKDIVVSIVDNFSVAVQMALFGKAYKSKASGGSRVEYNKMGGGRETRHSSYSVAPVYFDYREDAIEVLDIMAEVLDQKNEVSVADFYQLCKCDYDRTDKLWGWTRLRDIKPVRYGNEWEIKMPKPREL